MVLLIDNYDSFTYNLKQEIEILGLECRVVRNDEITIAEIEKLAPAQIVISPGPGHPDSSGITLEVIRRFSGKIPILGICLGHQAIGHAFGARVSRAQRPMHGKISKIKHKGEGVFRGLPNPLSVARYHSLVIEKKTLPPELQVTALSEDGEIMGVRSAKLKLEGVQFHPESIATEQGRALLKNFFSGGAHS